MGNKPIEYAEGSTYLVIKGNKPSYGRFWRLSGFRCLTRKPDVARDEIALKLELKLPAALFEKPLLAASINVDADVPMLELSPETIHTIEDLIRSTAGLDVQLTVVPPE